MGCKDGMVRSQFHLSPIIESSLKCKQIQQQWEERHITSLNVRKINLLAGHSIEDQLLTRWLLLELNKLP